MSRLLVEGFEGNSLGAFTLGNLSSFSVVSSDKYSGAYSVKVPSGYNVMLYASISAAGVQTVYYHIRFKPGEGGSGAFLSFRAGDLTTTQCCFCIVGTNSIEARRGGYDGTVLATSATGYIRSGWNTLAGKVVISNTIGEMTMRINGIPDINVTGVDTQYHASDDKAYFIHVGPWYGNFHDWYYDDIVIDDTDEIYDSRIESIVPNGAGSTTQLTPSTGANYECVNEIPASATDYVSGATADLLDTYAASSPVGPIGSILSVTVCVTYNKTGNPTAGKIKGAIRTGGTDYVGDSFDVPLTIGAKQLKTWELNPKTGVPWTSSDIDALEIGVKVVNS